MSHKNFLWWVMTTCWVFPTSVFSIDLHNGPDLQESMKSLLPRLHYFDDGVCIVHHMFGSQTTELIRNAYSDALLSAHFEVSFRRHSPQRYFFVSCIFAVMNKTPMTTPIMPWMKHGWHQQAHIRQRLLSCKVHLGQQSSVSNAMSAMPSFHFLV